MTDLRAALLPQVEAARAAARVLSRAPTVQKNAALLAMAAALRRESGRILQANEADLAAARAGGRTAAFLDRLALTPARLESMAKAVEEVATLSDPVGDVTASWRRPNGLRRPSLGRLTRNATPRFIIMSQEVTDILEPGSIYAGAYKILDIPGCSATLHRGGTRRSEADHPTRSRMRHDRIAFAALRRSRSRDGQFQQGGGALRRQAIDAERQRPLS